MENSGKPNLLSQPTRREGELTKSVMTLVGQETDFQGKFDLGELNHKGSSCIKMLAPGRAWLSC